MKVTHIKQEVIIIEEPSEKMLDLIQRMREHKQKRREQMRESTPVFTIQA